MNEKLKTLKEYKELHALEKKENPKFKEPIVIIKYCPICYQKYKIDNSVDIHMAHMYSYFRKKYWLISEDDDEFMKRMRSLMWFEITNYSPKNFEYDETESLLDFPIIFEEMLKSGIYKKTKVKRVLNVYIADECVLTLIIDDCKLYTISKQYYFGKDMIYIYGGCRKGAGRKPMDESERKEDRKDYRKLVRLTKEQYEKLDKIRTSRKKKTGWSTILREIVEEYINKKEN